MDFQSNSRQKRRRKLDPVLELATYGQWLQFYSQPPTEIISLQELEELALARIKVLKTVEHVGVLHLKSSQEYSTTLETELKKLARDGVMRGLINSSHSLNDEESERRVIEERRKDHLSHFILRLAYCKTEELRRWFITQECDLFKFRFSRQTSHEAQEFLTFNNLRISPISEEEKLSLSDELVHSQPNLTEANLHKTDFYKVHFTEAIELVRSCRVYLRKGYAYVPHNDLIIIVLNIFRTKLSHDLAIAARHLPQLDEEERLLPLLSEISRVCSVGQEYNTNKHTNNNNKLTHDIIDSVSAQSFPLCMQSLHQSLRTHHHLRHTGRMQYGLFLKAAGLSLEQALMFWRQEFTRVMDSDKFDKQYSYNIRHNYGKEGKRADYTPYSCMKIIMNNPPNTGDYHGCPYRHWDADILRQRLSALRVSSFDCGEIVDLAKQGHYQLACGRYFDSKHHMESKFIPQHPNQYYESSVQALEGMTLNYYFSQEGHLALKNLSHSRHVYNLFVDMLEETRLPQFRGKMAIKRGTSSTSSSGSAEAHKAVLVQSRASNTATNSNNNNNSAANSISSATPSVDEFTDDLPEECLDEIMNSVN